MKKYFITYSWSAKDHNSGFGAIKYYTKKKIKTWEDLQLINLDIKNNTEKEINQTDIRTVILNWRRIK